MNEGEINGIQNWEPKFSLIVVCKRHNKRFAVDKGRAYENPKTGTVIDDTVTRIDMTQFYMQPHHANQVNLSLFLELHQYFKIILHLA